MNAPRVIGKHRAQLALLGLFTLTVFLGALLVFGVQPIAARLLLPWFGGSPAVWSATSLFFQLGLLAGYGYSHVVTQLRMRHQVGVHLVVLAIPLAFLPLTLPAGQGIAATAEPALAVLLVLAIGVGVPFAVASTTGPLLQRWFSFTGHPDGSDPYFLYAASNAGSLLVLLAYPFLLEPALSLADQAVAWSWGYVVFMLLAAACAVLVAVGGTAVTPGRRTDEESAGPLSWRHRLRWAVMAAVPAALSLSVTQHISTDIAAVPLLWIVPLAIYLGSFIIAFSRRQPLSPQVAGRMVPVAVAAVVVTPFLPVPIWLALASHLVLLFLAAVMCHGRLAAERPPPRRLTEFYLVLSIGGAFGGAFVSLIAPLVFDRVWEYPIAIIGVLLLLPPSHRVSSKRHLIVVAATVIATLVAVGTFAAVPEAIPLWVPWVVLALALTAIARWRVAFAFGMGALLAAVTFGGTQAIYTDRTFFGVYQVVAPPGRHELVHGTTIHGIQLRAPALRSVPTTYFHPSGPIGQVFESRGDTFERIGVVGLGVGTLAAYGTTAQHFTFYEIDPAVVALANDPKLFTYLDGSAATIDFVVGDGRLRLAADDTKYDLLVIDAFSSDAIPVHLLTREAVEIYADSLAPGGIIAFHITNRYLDLAPVVARVAKSLSLDFAHQGDASITLSQADQAKAESTWALLARDAGALDAFSGDSRWRAAEGQPSVRLWTDGYSDLIATIRWTE